MAIADPTARKIRAELDQLHDLDPSPVRRIGRRLGMPLGRVALHLGGDEDGWRGEPEITSSTWAPTREWIFDEVRRLASDAHPVLTILAKDPNLTYEDLVSDLDEIHGQLDRLSELALAIADLDE